MIHQVSGGETLAGIAARYGISTALLAAENGLEPQQRLAVGQALLVLVPEAVHTVLAGDTLGSIAAAQQVTVNYLYRLNPWLNGLPDLLPGEEIVLRYTDQPSSSLLVSGYAYPVIPPSALRTILPSLSYVLSFSCGFTEQGSLLLPEDDKLRQLAREQGVPVLLVLTPLNEYKQFDNGLITSVLNDNEARSRLLSELTVVMSERGYAGLDLDFEYVREEDAVGYVGFAAELGLIMHRQSRLLTVALAPKYYAEQSGLLYEGHDYQSLGRVADLALIMTYEWGYSFGPPMAVSPIYQVERVLNYALSEIPADKLLMGMSNYGYDWLLPYQSGRSATTVSPQRAVQIAVENGAEISYDEEAQAPYFYYTDGEGQPHVVWFEDVRSISARAALASRLGLRGVCLWTLNREFPALYLLLAASYFLEPLDS